MNPASRTISAPPNPYGEAMSEEDESATEVRVAAREVDRIRRQLAVALAKRNAAIRSRYDYIERVGARAFAREVGEDLVGESTITSTLRPVREARAAEASHTEGGAI